MEGKLLRPYRGTAVSPQAKRNLSYSRRIDNMNQDGKFG
jgi:hypothetical protein